MPVTSASAPIDRPSRPMCEASASAASRIAARVCRPFISGRVGRRLGGRPAARRRCRGDENPRNDVLDAESVQNRTIVLFCRKRLPMPAIGVAGFARSIADLHAFERGATDEGRGRRPRRRRRPDRGAAGARRPRGLGAGARRDAGPRARATACRSRARASRSRRRSTASDDARDARPAGARRHRRSRRRRCPPSAPRWRRCSARRRSCCRR